MLLKYLYENAAGLPNSFNLQPLLGSSKSLFIDILRMQILEPVLPNRNAEKPLFITLFSLLSPNKIEANVEFLFWGFLFWFFLSKVKGKEINKNPSNGVLFQNVSCLPSPVFLSIVKYSVLLPWSMHISQFSHDVTGFKKNEWKLLRGRGAVK